MSNDEGRLARIAQSMDAFYRRIGFLACIVLIVVWMFLKGGGLKILLDSLEVCNLMLSVYCL